MSDFLRRHVTRGWTTPLLSSADRQRPSVPIESLSVSCEPFASGCQRMDMSTGMNLYRRVRQAAGSGLLRLCLAVASVVGVAGLWTAEAMANAVDWQMNLQRPMSPIMERIESFHHLLLWVCVLISVFVLALLVYAAVRFNEKRNPVPSKTTHHTLLEVIWTAAPVLILVIIAVPSFKLLYFEEVQPKIDLTIKAIGKQWYWTYEYPDNGNFTFDAIMVEDDQLQPGQPRLLTTDNEVVLPAGVNVRIQVTAADVLHSWAMPVLGVKMDGVPGRLNEVWVHVNEPGVYYGQCSELCGTRHGFMPIKLRALPQPEFDAWVEQAKTKFAKVDDGQPLRLAATSAAK